MSLITKKSFSKRVVYLLFEKINRCRYAIIRQHRLKQINQRAIRQNESINQL